MYFENIFLKIPFQKQPRYQYHSMGHRQFGNHMQFQLLFLRKTDKSQKMNPFQSLVQINGSKSSSKEKLEVAPLDLERRGWRREPDEIWKSTLASSRSPGTSSSLLLPIQGLGTSQKTWRQQDKCNTKEDSMILSHNKLYKHLSVAQIGSEGLEKFREDKSIECG